MEDFLERQKRILPGSGKLSEKTVAVFGLGGVGGYAAEAIVRAGVGSVVLIDYDFVELTNKNRQLLALDSTLGIKKTEVAYSRFKEINTNLNITCFNIFVGHTNIDEIFLNIKCDFIIDAIDTVTGKLAITECAAKTGMPLISCMGAGNKLHPELFRIADINETSVCPLCRVMRRELKKRGITKLTVVYSEEIPTSAETTPGGNGCEANADITESKTAKTPPGSVSFVPGAAGFIAAGFVIRSLLNIN